MTVIKPIDYRTVLALPVSSLSQTALRSQSVETRLYYERSLINVISMHPSMLCAEMTGALPSGPKM